MPKNKTQTKQLKPHLQIDSDPDFPEDYEWETWACEVYEKVIVV